MVRSYGFVYEEVEVVVWAQEVANHAPPLLLR